MKILNRIFTPNVTVSHEVGSSGSCAWFKVFGPRSKPILAISKGNKQNECLGIDMEFNVRDRNWCREVSHGGTTLGIGEYNYWIADNCLVGKLIKMLFI